MQQNMRGRYSVSQGQSCGAGCNVPVQPRQEIQHDHSCPNMVLAMAYVKSQPFVNLYNSCDAWKNGTLFADLNLPYTGGRTRC